MSFFSPELIAKRIELVKEALPKVRRIAFLANASNVSLRRAIIQAIERTATNLRVVVQRFEVNERQDFEAAFAAMAKQHFGAVTIEDDALLIGNSVNVAGLASKHRIPAIGVVQLANVGGIVGFGADFDALFYRSATYVDKILKGAKPGDLPVERATKFEMVVNVKSAKEFGIEIPQAVLLRADRVIE